jgi:hypothetical protein
MIEIRVMGITIACIRMDSSMIAPMVKWIYSVLILLFYFK